MCGCVDTSTVSAAGCDLENIIETETPPQSPALMSSETQPLMTSGRRRRSILVSVDDDDDVVCNAKMPDTAADEKAVPVTESRTSAEQVHTAVSSLPSSPIPDSPVAFSVCPLRLGKTFAFSSADSDARSGIVTAESFIQRQQQQVGRIAEYSKRDSLIDEAQLAVSFSLNTLLLLPCRTFFHIHHRTKSIVWGFLQCFEFLQCFDAVG